ncbi:hypothetical protein [Streptomyces sp. CC219B]|uniref:hypothetical protein n=1 Tax=Streptomyces sp. CC219B TaxID=3044574 RepID=UPI0024A94D8A|nr:hypothetical protein [Streptomyces sp. CC219B]
MAGTPDVGHWSEDGLPLDARRIKSAYERVRPALRRDRLFVENAAAFDVDVEELDLRMARPPGRLDAGTLWDWLGGADQYRWAGLRVLAEGFAVPGALRLAGRITVPEGSLRVATGDVVVEGDLVLEDQAMVLVLATLTVTGALVGSLWDYSMVAAAEVSCRDGVTSGEILALDAVRCTGALHLSGNDYACRAPLFDGGVLVDFERSNAFGRVDAAERITEWNLTAAARALGLSADDELDQAYADRLLAVGPSAAPGSG